MLVPPTYSMIRMSGEMRHRGHDMNRSHRLIDWQESHSILWAHVSCLCLGLGLITRGLLPIFAERIVAGVAPSGTALLVGSVAVMLGGAFCGLHVLIRRRVAWAALTGAALSGGLMLAAAAATLVGESSPAAFILAGLCGAVACSTWLAVGACRAAPRRDDAVRSDA